MTRAFTLIVLTTCLLLGGAGCGEQPGPPRVKVYPVTGKLTVNGKPIFGIPVVLHPTDQSGDGHPAPSAVTEANGSFKITTYVPGDGAPAGNYVLTTSKSSAGGPAVVQIVGAYSTQSRPLATVTVKEADNNVLDAIDLKGK